MTMLSKNLSTSSWFFGPEKQTRLASLRVTGWLEISLDGPGKKHIPMPLPSLQCHAIDQTQQENQSHAVVRSMGELGAERDKGGRKEGSFL